MILRYRPARLTGRRGRLNGRKEWLAQGENRCHTHCHSSPSCFRSSRASEEQSRMTFRVLGPHERGRFAPEAWGHLLALSGSGALNAAELEHIIERALIQIDGRIALDDLRSLLEGAGYIESSDGDTQQTVH
ncbi:MAG TPA: DUF494 family protein [Gemmatimonadaceae bacterium]|nr:DUF494 family protein [Gemmatimonadaceae bacterium]